MNNRRNRPKKPKPFKPDLPQCEAPVDDSCWAEHYRKRRLAKMEYSGYNPKLCNKGGTVHLFGHNYCAQHAGILALAVILKEVGEIDAYLKGPELVSQLSAGP